MFENTFSSKGRIRRLEFGLSILLLIVITIAQIILSLDLGFIYAEALLNLTMLWFIIPQGIKRCHDLGKSGWSQFLPFYFIWMIFKDGQQDSNKYGENPKGAKLQKDCSLNIDDDFSADKEFQESINSEQNKSNTKIFSKNEVLNIEICKSCRLNTKAKKRIMKFANTPAGIKRLTFVLVVIYSIFPFKGSGIYNIICDEYWDFEQSYSNLTYFNDVYMPNFAVRLISGILIGIALLWIVEGFYKEKK